MPRRKKPEETPKPEVQPTEKPVEVKPETQPTTTTTATTAERPVVEKPAAPTAPTEGFTIKEATWEEFERFAPAPRGERPKSRLREAFEMAAFHGKVVRIEGLTPAQVRAVLAAVSMWNVKTTAKVQVKYDMAAGVVYLAPAERPAEKQ